MGEGKEGNITRSEPKTPREGAGDNSSGNHTPGLFRFTIRGRVNFGLSVMAEAARMADSAIRSKEEEEETEINFRLERNHIGEGLDLFGVVKTASPIK